MVRLDVFHFADTKLSTIVQHGLHAVAIDEERADFTPTLWDAATRITQVLFPGAHADVGGGYPATGGESGLSDGAFAWMASELGKLGVLFAAKPTFSPNPDAQGTAHQPWTQTLWKGLPRGARVAPTGAFPAGMTLAQSALDRIRGGAVVAEPGVAAAAYAPLNLTAYLVGKAAVAGVVIA